MKPGQQVEQSQQSSIVNDPYTTELNKSIQKIIKQDPKRAAGEKYFQKDLLLLIFKPNEVPGLQRNQEAREAAHNLYLELQKRAMEKVAAEFELPPPAYEEKEVASPVEFQVPPRVYPEPSAPPMPSVSANEASYSPPPSYEQACDAYRRNRRYCESRRVVWCNSCWDDGVWCNYYEPGFIETYLFVRSVCFAIELSLYGAMLIPNMVRSAAVLGIVADNSLRGNSKHCNGYVIGAIVVAAIALGLLAFASSELIKAYQEDKDSHSYQRRLTIIAPTLIASAAAGYCAAAFVAAMTGLTVSTGGIALAVLVAVSLTAVLSVLTFKLLTNLASTHRYTLTENEQGRLEARGVDAGDVQRRIDAKRDKNNQLDWSGLTFFTSDTNKKIRENRREIYNLRTHGYEVPPPRYGS